LAAVYITVTRRGRLTYAERHAPPCPWFRWESRRCI